MAWRVLEWQRTGFEQARRFLRSRRFSSTKAHLRNARDSLSFDALTCSSRRKRFHGNVIENQFISSIYRAIARVRRRQPISITALSAIYAPLPSSSVADVPGGKISLINQFRFPAGESATRLLLPLNNPYNRSTYKGKSVIPINAYFQSAYLLPWTNLDDHNNTRIIGRKNCPPHRRLHDEKWRAQIAIYRCSVSPVRIEQRQWNEC